MDSLMLLLLVLNYYLFVKFFSEIVPKTLFNFLEIQFIYIFIVIYKKYF